MPRAYTVSFENKTIADANIFLRLAAHASKVLIITGLQLDQVEAVTSAQMRLVMQRLTVDVTGGTAITPRPMDPGDSAAGFTALEGTFSAQGTAGVLLRQHGFNVLGGLPLMFPPQNQIVVPPGGLLAFKFGAIPATATDNFSLTVDCLEIG